MAKQEKYKVNDYSRLNQCSRRKIVFSIRQLLHFEVTTIPSSLSIYVFSSLRLEPKRKKTSLRQGSLRIRHETLAPLHFSSEIPSEHKHIAKIKMSIQHFYHVLSALPTEIVYKFQTDILQAEYFDELNETVTALHEILKPEMLDKSISSSTLIGKTSFYLNDTSDENWNE